MPGTSETGPYLRDRHSITWSAHFILKSCAVRPILLVRHDIDRIFSIMNPDPTRLLGTDKRTRPRSRLESWNSCPNTTVQQKSVPDSCRDVGQTRPTSNTVLWGIFLPLILTSKNPVFRSIAIFLYCTFIRPNNAFPIAHSPMSMCSCPSETLLCMLFRQ